VASLKTEASEVALYDSIAAHFNRKHPHFTFEAALSLPGFSFALS
jgi:hypothetical protein